MQLLSILSMPPYDNLWYCKCSTFLKEKCKCMGFAIRVYSLYSRVRSWKAAETYSKNTSLSAVLGGCRWCNVLLPVWQQQKVWHRWSYSSAGTSTFLQVLKQGEIKDTHGSLAWVAFASHFPRNISVVLACIMIQYNGIIFPVMVASDQQERN